MAPRASSHSAGRLVEESALSPGFGDSKGGKVGGSTRNFLGQGAFDIGWYRARPFNRRASKAAAVGGKKAGPAEGVRHYVGDRSLAQHVGRGL